MKVSNTIHVELSEEETYHAIEMYIRNKILKVNGLDLDGYEVDDADSTCGKDGKGAYFLFLFKEEE